MPKIETKHDLLGGFLGLEIWKAIVVFKINKIQCVQMKNLSYLKQHPQICQIEKFHKKTKMPKIGTNHALLDVFWDRSLKSYCGI